MTSKTDADPYELKRFVDAQSAVYAKVTEELSAGRKRSHWMWFIFPQIAGLGFSATAQRFAIGTKGEAAAYLAHDILGPRLIECTRLVMSASDQPISAICSRTSGRYRQHDGDSPKICMRKSSDDADGEKSFGSET
jgi:uncharacterized protein (DUF1810 family)